MTIREKDHAMNQREKDMEHASRWNGRLSASQVRLFADGAAYGRADLAKLERLLRAGWVFDVPKYGHRWYMRHYSTFAEHSGATLADALAQVEE